MTDTNKTKAKQPNFYQVTSNVGNYSFIGHMFGKAPVFIPSSLLTEPQIKGLKANKRLEVKEADKKPEPPEAVKNDDKSKA